MLRTILSLVVLTALGSTVGCRADDADTARPATTEPAKAAAPTAGKQVIGQTEERLEYKPEEIVRVETSAIQPLVASGKALLVCAYDNETKFQQVRLEGAISLSDLRSRLPELTKDARLVFY